MPAIAFHAPGVTYNGLHATTNPTAAQVAADLATTRQHFSHVRTYYPQYGGGAGSSSRASSRPALWSAANSSSVRRIPSLMPVRGAGPRSR